MKTLIETYEIWKESGFKDKDMKKAFSRKCSDINSVIKLIERIQELENDNHSLNVLLDARHKSMDEKDREIARIEAELKLKDAIIEQSGNSGELPQTRYDWSKAPRWANFAAKDIIKGEPRWYGGHPNSWEIMPNSLEQRPKEG